MFNWWRKGTQQCHSAKDKKSRGIFSDGKYKRTIQRVSDVELLCTGRNVLDIEGIKGGGVLVERLDNIRGD